jgi:asparagine synthase (glutamine-hydrolysing)
VCGIFATNRVARWEGRASEVLALLAHRGPDASGTWRAPRGDALLAHTRLEIIGLGAPGAQPLTSSDGSVVVTFNGEIYNYRELAAALDMDRPASDTAVLAEILARWGSDGIHRLRGMYAFAAWDTRRSTLIAGRDRFGIKPLYVLHHRDGGIAIASELPPLLLDDEARTLDPLGLAQFVAFGHTGPIVTVYDRVRKLNPGVVWEWQADSARLRSEGQAIEPLVTEDVELAAAIDDTVAAHLVADVEIGVFLSGGVDSTLVAASAASQVPELRTFTIAFPDRPAIDESGLAEQNAAALGTRHITTPVHDHQMADAAITLTSRHGEPVGDAAGLALTVLAGIARQDVKVVLTGEGADEIFGGYRRYDASRRLGAVPSFVAAGPGHNLARRQAWRRDDRPRARAAEALLWGGGIRSHAALLGAEINALVDGDDELFADVLRLARSDWRALATDAEHETARRFDMARWLPNVYLEKVDRATMACSLEARVPYLDPVIERTAARLPFGKDGLRSELLRRLPAAVLPERKLGLAIHLPTLLAQPALSDGLRYQLGSPNSVIHRTFSPAAIERLRQRARRSPSAAFRLAMVGVWESAVAVSPP